MSAPTPIVRQAVYNRDNKRCVSCDTTEGLTFLDRRIMDGPRSRPGAVDGLTICETCRDVCAGELQSLALARGWLVKRHTATHVPVYAPHLFGWFLFEGVKARRITGPTAIELMWAVYGQQYARWSE